MAPLFKVIMNEYQVKLETVFAWCMACGWTVVDLHQLFSRIYNVVHYRQLWRDADTPETTALAAWSRDIAIDDLHRFMRARCFSSEIRMAVVWLYNHVP